MKQRQLTSYGLPRCGTRVRFWREQAKGFAVDPLPQGIGPIHYGSGFVEGNQPWYEHAGRAGYGCGDRFGPSIIAGLRTFHGNSQDEIVSCIDPVGNSRRGEFLSGPTQTVVRKNCIDRIVMPREQCHSNRIIAGKSTHFISDFEPRIAAWITNDMRFLNRDRPDFSSGSHYLVNCLAQVEVEPVWHHS